MKQPYFSIFCFILTLIISITTVCCYANDTFDDDILLDNDQIVMTSDEFEQSKINVEVSPTPVIVDNSDIISAFHQSNSQILLTFKDNLSSEFSQYNLDYFSLLPLLEKYEFIVVDQIEDFYFLKCNDNFYILSRYDLIPLGAIYD